MAPAAYLTGSGRVYGGIAIRRLGGSGTNMWWAIALPSRGRDDQELNGLFFDAYLVTAGMLLALLVVHIGGALYHASRRDSGIRRMSR